MYLLTIVFKTRNTLNKLLLDVGTVRTLVSDRDH